MMENDDTIVLNSNDIVQAPDKEMLIIIEAKDPSAAILETNLGLDVDIEIVIENLQDKTTLRVPDVEQYRVYAP
jgi:hypothetical protein